MTVVTDRSKLSAYRSIANSHSRWKRKPKMRLNFDSCPMLDRTFGHGRWSLDAHLLIFLNISMHAVVIIIMIRQKLDRPYPQKPRSQMAIRSSRIILSHQRDWCCELDSSPNNQAHSESLSVVDEIGSLVPTPRQPYQTLRATFTGIKSDF